MTCARCAGMARENAALREEVAAWRGGASDEDRRRDAALRLQAWKSGLQVAPGVAAAAIQLAESGVAVSFERLAASRRGRDGGEPDLAKVYVCQLKAAIRALGLRPAIECIRGFGYRMERDAARALIARLDIGDG